MQELHREPGVLCKVGGFIGTDHQILDESATTDVVQQELPAKAAAAAPPFCMKGFDLDGLVKCDDAKTTLLTIETDGDANFKDWLGVTCPIKAP